jgi:hypothetical protein
VGNARGTQRDDWMMFRAWKSLRPLLPAIAIIRQSGHRGGRKTMTQTNDEGSPPLPSLPPADFYDPVIEAYKKDVDRTLLRENLTLTFEQRVEKAQRVHESIELVRGIARQARLGPARSDEP